MNTESEQELIKDTNVLKSLDHSNTLKVYEYYYT